MKYLYIVFLLFVFSTETTSSASQVMPNIGSSGKTSSFKDKVGGMQNNFGGKILSTKIPGVECIGQPFIMRGAISSLIGNVRGNFSGGDLKNYLPYVIPPENYGDTVSPTGQILGKYKIIPDMKTCFIPGPTPIYIPAYIVTKYGSN